MSRLPWRDHVLLWVAPSELGLVLRRRGLRPAIERHRHAIVAAGGADAAVESLARIGANAGPRGARACVVVSNRLVRTALLADGRALRGGGERQLAAREMLRAVHGDAVDGWTVSVDPVAACGLPAVAVDSGWLQRLRDAARRAGLRTVSVRPLLAVAAQRAWTHLAGRHAWMLVTESDGALLARIDEDGAWRSVHELPFDGARGAEAVPQWLERCALLDAVEPAELPLVHVAWNGVAAASATAWETSRTEAAGWRIRTIALDAADL